MQVTLASASGHITFQVAQPPVRSNQEHALACAIGIAKRATVRTGDGEVYLDSPLAPQAEDDRGTITVDEACDLMCEWAGMHPGLARVVF